MELLNKLRQPLTMSMFGRVAQLVDEALKQRAEAADEIEALDFERTALRAERDELLGVLKACRSRFEEYALLHYRKRTAEGDEKALSNQRMATLCDDAIAKAEGK